MFLCPHMEQIIAARDVLIRENLAPPQGTHGIGHLQRTAMIADRIWEGLPMRHDQMDENLPWLGGLLHDLGRKDGGDPDHGYRGVPKAIRACEKLAEAGLIWNSPTLFGKVAEIVARHPFEQAGQPSALGIVRDADRLELMRIGVDVFDPTKRPIKFHFIYRLESATLIEQVKQLQKEVT